LANSNTTWWGSLGREKSNKWNPAKNGKPSTSLSGSRPTVQRDPTFSAQWRREAPPGHPSPRTARRMWAIGLSECPTGLFGGFYPIRLECHQRSLRPIATDCSPFCLISRQGDSVIAISDFKSLECRKKCRFQYRLTGIHRNWKIDICSGSLYIDGVLKVPPRRPPGQFTVTFALHTCPLAFPSPDSHRKGSSSYETPR
jgi:hypothetical protein